jgi:hypothetical protein
MTGLASHFEMSNAHDQQTAQAMKRTKLSLSIFNNIQFSEIEPGHRGLLGGIFEAENRYFRPVVPGDIHGIFECDRRAAADQDFAVVRLSG